MDVVLESCAGIDVHKEQVTVCVLSGAPGRKTVKQTRVFRTFTPALMELATWLRSLGVTVVGMESTGVYWKPVYAVLEAEGGFSLVVGNAQHIKNVPGRKTDVKDAEWIASLLRPGSSRRASCRHGYSSASGPGAVSKVAGPDQNFGANRLQKLLEAANVKLASVVSDVFA